MNLILDFIDDSINYGTLKYDANGGLDKKTFLSSNIFTPRSVSYTSEDYIGGNIGSIAFELSETLSSNADNFVTPSTKFATSSPNSFFTVS